MSSAGHGIAAEKQSDKERIDMKKRLIMVLMIAAFSVAAAACGSSKSEETTAAPEAEVQEAFLRVAVPAFAQAQGLESVPAPLEFQQVFLPQRVWRLQGRL